MIPRRARLPLTIALVQLLLALLLLLRGFPYFGTAAVSQGRVWELPVAIVHLPGIGVLRTAGLCCGVGRGAVLPARMVAGHVPMRPTGVVLLAGANWASWTMLLLLAQWLWSRRRTRTPVAGPPGPS